MHVTPGYSSTIQIFQQPVRLVRELSTQMLVWERVMPDDFESEREKFMGRRPRAFQFAVLAEPF